MEKDATTPFKALDPSKFRFDVLLNRNAFGFNEIYKELDTQKIALLQQNSGDLDRFAREMKNTSSKGQSADITVCLIKFISKKSDPFPNRKEIEFLTDVAHSPILISFQFQWLMQG